MNGIKHKKRIFSGVQPTGNLHIGNYLGAVKNFVKFQSAGNETLYCIVDLHAITVWQDPEELRNSIRELAATFIACGLDSNKSILFNQSQVSSHSELAWVFNCVTRVGWLNRMTQFKAKAGKNKENASVGLYVYPSLMAADILAYHATHVPVGEDQKQHLELTRDIATKFNNDYKVPNFFPCPEPIIEKTSPRIMSLRDGSKKMSKSETSDMSRINLTDVSDQIAFADHLIINKTKEMSGRLGQIEERVLQINPFARVTKTNHGELQVSKALNQHNFELPRIEAELLDTEIEDHDHEETSKHNHIHEAEITSLSLVSTNSFDAKKLEDWLQDTLSKWGSNILRTKGILSIDGKEEKLVIQAVNMMLEGDFKGVWGSQNRVSKLVFIGR